MGVLIPIIALSIPIVAILSHTYLKAKTMASKRSELSIAETEELILMRDEINILREQSLKLEEQNLKLEERIKNLETISANPEFGTHELPPASDEMKIKIKAKEKLKS